MNIVISFAISFFGCRITGTDFFSLFTLTLTALDLYEGWRKHTDEKCALHKSTSETLHIYLESNIPRDEITLAVEEHRNL